MELHALWVEMEAHVDDVHYVLGPPRFKGIRKPFASEVEAWKQHYDSTEPQHEKLPGSWNDKLVLFQKIIALRCLHPDKVGVTMVTDYW